jgi:hypothetical protein
MRSSKVPTSSRPASASTSVPLNTRKISSGTLSARGIPRIMALTNDIGTHRGGLANGIDGIPCHSTQIVMIIFVIQLRFTLPMTQF